MTTYEILRDRGMITRHYGRECLGYIVDVGNGKRENRTTTNLNKDIEVEREESPLKEVCPCLGIKYGLEKDKEPDFLKRVEEKKEEAFIAIVIRLQAENLYPKSAIHIWTEDEDWRICVYGVCKVEPKLPYNYTK